MSSLLSARPPSDASGPLYLGFDSSTQGLKVTAIDGDCKVFFSTAINFDNDLPEFGTVNGMHAKEGGEVTSPCLMWVAALDRVFGDMQREGFPFGRVAAVSGSGQQHGSVYWGKTGQASLAALDPAQPLAPQLAASFAHLQSPIWADSSTVSRASKVTGGGAAALQNRK